jgi:hypothetical protein
MFEFIDNLSSNGNIFAFDAVDIYFAFFKAFKRYDFSLSDEWLKLPASLKNFVDQTDERIFHFNLNLTHYTFVLTVLAA